LGQLVEKRHPAVVPRVVAGRVSRSSAKALAFRQNRHYTAGGRVRNDETREMLRERIARAHDHRLALIGFPYDASSSFMKGAAEAPPRIRAAFRSEASNLWSESGVDLGADGILHDLGDVPFQARDDVVDKIDTAVSEVLDALDPAFAPGVSHHEPGGFSTRQVLDLIHALEGEVVGADIVELNPRRDPAKITEMAAAKVWKEIAARMLAR
jgi:arginase family enzyme